MSLLIQVTPHAPINFGTAGTLPSRKLITNRYSPFAIFLTCQLTKSRFAKNWTRQEPNILQARVFKKVVLVVGLKAL